MSQDSNWPTFRSLLSTSFNFLSHLSCRAKDYTKEALEHLILALGIYLLICIFLYIAILKWNLLDFRKDVKNPRRILIVIAHPDDECMFFGPTILNFTRNKQCKVYLMCLTTGHNCGVGKTRKKELYDSCRVLGIEEECVIIQKHSMLPDSMFQKWPAELIASLIVNHVETYDIDTVVSFDKHGISRHVNHCSIYYAIANLSLEKKLPSSCKVYVLESVNMLRKYWFFFDIPLSYVMSRNR